MNVFEEKIDKEKHFLNVQKMFNLDKKVKPCHVCAENDANNNGQPFSNGIKCGFYCSDDGNYFSDKGICAHLRIDNKIIKKYLKKRSIKEMKKISAFCVAWYNHY